MGDLVEQLAALEHDQWTWWTSKVVERYGCLLPEFLVEKWKKLWVPYDQLTESDKDFDREWARKAIAIMQSQAKLQSMS